MKHGVYDNGQSTWDLFVNGKYLARFRSNEQAWREFDRISGEAKSRAEDTTDWMWKKRLNA